MDVWMTFESILRNLNEFILLCEEIKKNMHLANKPSKQSLPLFNLINKMRDIISDGITQFGILKIFPDEAVRTLNRNKYKHVVHTIDLGGKKAKYEQQQSSIQARTKNTANRVNLGGKKHPKGYKVRKNKGKSSHKGKSSQKKRGRKKKNQLINQ